MPAPKGYPCTNVVPQDREFIWYDGIMFLDGLQKKTFSVPARE